MQLPDLNLLPALDALLRTGSVAGAAEELNVSASAMSRTLGRLRRVVGDPLLVPSGRGLTRTEHAAAMAPHVAAALSAAIDALRPREPLDLSQVRRDLVVRTNDAVAVVFGSALTARVAAEAPGVRLHIIPEGDEQPADLRDRVDLDLGVLPDLPSDIRSRPLLSHRYVAVARSTAPWANQPLTLERFVELPHLTVSRRGRARSVIDDRLADRGLTRHVLATVPTMSAACFLALRTDALALVSVEFAAHVTGVLPITVLEIPLDLPVNQLDMAWHRRADDDPVHRWLRDTLAELAAALRHPSRV